MKLLLLLAIPVCLASNREDRQFEWLFGRSSEPRPASRPIQHRASQQIRRGPVAPPPPRINRRLPGPRGPTNYQPPQRKLSEDLFKRRLLMPVIISSYSTTNIQGNGKEDDLEVAVGQPGQPRQPEDIDNIDASESLTNALPEPDLDLNTNVDLDTDLEGPERKKPSREQPPRPRKPAEPLIADFKLESPTLEIIEDGSPYHPDLPASLDQGNQLFSGEDERYQLIVKDTRVNLNQDNSFETIDKASADREVDTEDNEPTDAKEVVDYVDITENEVEEGLDQLGAPADDNGKKIQEKVSGRPPFQAAPPRPPPNKFPPKKFLQKKLAPQDVPPTKDTPTSSSFFDFDFMSFLKKKPVKPVNPRISPSQPPLPPQRFNRPPLPPPINKAGLVDAQITETNQAADPQLAELEEQKEEEVENTARIDTEDTELVDEPEPFIVTGQIEPSPPPHRAPYHGPDGRPHHPPPPGGRRPPGPHNHPPPPPVLLRKPIHPPNRKQVPFVPQRVPGGGHPFNRGQPRPPLPPNEVKHGEVGGHPHHAHHANISQLTGRPVKPPTISYRRKDPNRPGSILGNDVPTSNDHYGEGTDFASHLSSLLNSFFSTTTSPAPLPSLPTLVEDTEFADVVKGYANQRPSSKSPPVETEASSTSQSSTTDSIKPIDEELDSLSAPKPLEPDNVIENPLVQPKKDFPKPFLSNQQKPRPFLGQKQAFLKPKQKFKQNLGKPRPVNLKPLRQPPPPPRPDLKQVFPRPGPSPAVVRQAQQTGPQPTQRPSDGQEEEGAQDQSVEQTTAYPDYTTFREPQTTVGETSTPRRPVTTTIRPRPTTTQRPPAPSTVAPPRPTTVRKLPPTSTTTLSPSIQRVVDEYRNKVHVVSQDKLSSTVLKTLQKNFEQKKNIFEQFVSIEAQDTPFQPNSEIFTSDWTRVEPLNGLQSIKAPDLGRSDRIEVIQTTVDPTTERSSLPPPPSTAKSASAAEANVFPDERNAEGGFRPMIRPLHSPLLS